MSKKSLEKALREAIDGDVRFDKVSRQAYSVDASIYEIEPQGIVTPRHRKDILTIIAIAKDYKIPLTVRGAATGITGGAIGRGLIVDISKYFNEIQEINIKEEYVICKPGVIQDALNKELSPHGYRLGPDTSTGNRATIGGMLANNAAGSRSLRYGKMVDHILEMDVALSSGEVVTFLPLDETSLAKKKAIQSQEGNIYRLVDQIRKNEKENIDKHFPKIPRRVSGYNLDELVKKGPLNLSQLIVGSEGSLGIILSAKLRICKKPKYTGLCLIHCNEMITTMMQIPKLLDFNPLALEMIDNKILSAACLHPKMQNKINWLIGNPQALFIAELEADSYDSLMLQLNNFQAFVNSCNIGYATALITEPNKMAEVWEIRKAGLGLLLSKRSYSRAIAFIEDISLPPHRLGVFMEKFLSYLKSIGKEAGIYGHVGSGCMHIRPYIDLRDKKELRLMETSMQVIANLLLEHDGALSGEHGDGYIRSWLNEKMFGKNLYESFCQIKQVFDPENLMNPGKVVHPENLLHDLRISPETEITKIDTFLDFTKEGGFELAADLCNGNGLCRKSESLMCPSFQATKDEYDTTRARAQALRAVINGKWPKKEFTGDGIYSVLDLCLECRGCKTECPSQVDMAKMKSEFLYQYQEKNGYFFRNRLFGNIGILNKLSSPFANIFNTIGRGFVGGKLLNFIGISDKRKLPQLSNERFSSWVKGQVIKAEENNNASVVLFNDTYNEFNSPQVGKSAYTVLKKMGYNVIVPPWKCCGRPMISKGLLRQARDKAIAIVEMLFPYAEKNIPIVGLEPSCILTIQQDLCDLISKDDLEIQKKINKIAPLCMPFDVFLKQHINEGKLPLKLQTTKQSALVHGHCHQKALIGTQATLDVLNAMEGVSAQEINSGCCGMAGSFGYEKEHYDLSMKIGSLKLFPAINSAPSATLVVANGVSCRTQIEHGTERKAQHLAEVIAARLS